MNVKKRILLIALAFATIWFISMQYFLDELGVLPSVIVFLLVYGVAWSIPSLFAGKLIDPGQISKKTFGIFFLFASVDLITPIYAFSRDGSLICSANDVLCHASTGAVIGSFWRLLGINGHLLWLFTYPITFLILIIIALNLLSKRQLLQELN